MLNKKHARNKAQQSTPPKETTLQLATMVPDTEANAPLRVVGIGASAGGLGALKILLPHIPSDSKTCLVIVMHLSSEHESHLADLLQASSQVPVRQLTGSTPLEANHIFVIPPGNDIEVTAGHLHLSQHKKQRTKRDPIDHFFDTLAKAHGPNAVGIVLTGTGSDGTTGLRSIRDAGGLTLVQSPDEAEYDAMPRSAVEAGVADFVLPIREIAAQFLDHDAVSEGTPFRQCETPAVTDPEGVLREILNFLQKQAGHDFSHYKQATVYRRVLRRMQMHRNKNLREYLQILKTNDKEVSLLFEDLLITVTSFFRDPPVFDYLATKVVPELLAGKGATDHIRVWSVGCATGEEAYSLCMLLLEGLPRNLFTLQQLQIFATDLHESSLARAREAVFPTSIEADVSPQRLEQFFVPQNGRYRVKRPIREQIVFALHNVLQDPPFSRLQLVSCRNVLIYLQRDIQKKLMALFHYALEEDGFLLVGSAEGVDSDLFTCENKKLGVYRRRSVPTHGLKTTNYPLTTSQHPPKPSRSNPPASYGLLHEQAVELYAPPSLLIDSRGELLHYSARAGNFLQFPGGSPTNNVFRLLPAPLRYELRAALHVSRDTEKSYRSRLIETTLNGRLTRVTLSVYAIKKPNMEGFALVVFDEMEIATGEHTEKPEPLSHLHTLALSEELTNVKKHLQSMAEEHEITLERMQASHEELESSNEELRSTMEELETSKEEMQSINEELNSLNQENVQKVEELKQLSNDLHNLLKATHIPTVFLNREMRIIRFTPSMSDLFNLRPSDHGRALADLTHQLKYENLSEDIRHVLECREEVEREIEDSQGNFYLARLQLYRTDEEEVQGIVITFIDISDRKRTEKLVQEAKDLAEKIIETVRTPMLVLGHDLRMRSANEAFLSYFDLDAQAVENAPITELKYDHWDLPALKQRLERIIPEGITLVDYEVEITFEKQETKTLLVNARQIGHGELILMSLEDVTERKRIRLALEESQQKLEKLVVERTMEIRQKTERLQDLVHELSTAEQRERKRMASILHDDLQQLLVAAKMQMEMCKRDLSATTLAECLERAISHIDVSLETTHSLVRQSNPRILYEKGLFPAVKSLCAEMQEKHGLTVLYRFPKKEFELGNDVKTLLFESLRELFFNIVKHAHVEEATMAFEVTPGNVWIRVSDKGTGFSVESKSAEKSRSEFGLFSVCARIEAMGGVCTITSAPSEGTTVKIGFQPIRKEIAPALADAPQRKRTDPTKDSGQSPVSPFRIVVVDDHALVREGIVRILQVDARMEVVGEAADGAEAVEMVGRCLPDVVLMDINMPRLNGIAATREIHARWPQIRVIALSMQDIDSEEAYAITSAGAVGFLRKSDDSGMMISTLLTLMKE